MSAPISMQTLALASLALASLVPAQSAQEWPRFRGPNGSGTTSAKGLPSSFGPISSGQVENLRWRAPFVAGHSSPVLGDGTVFVTGANDSLVVACFDRATGKERWKLLHGRARTQEVYPANGSATPSPTTDGKNVYAFFPEYGLLALDAATGEERWSLPLGPFSNFYGMAGSPILAGDTLVLLCDQPRDSFLLAVDAATGKERWRTERKGLIESWTTPVLYPAEKPEAVAVFGTFFVCGYSLATGQELWRHGSVGYTPVCSPVLWERPEGAILFASSPFQAEGGGMPTFEVLCTDADKDKDGKLVKAELVASGFADHFGWVDVDGDGFVEAAEWTSIADGMSSKDYGLVAFRVGSKEAKEVWRHKRGLPGIASPLVADGVLYLVKSGGMLTTLDAASGEELGFQRLEQASGEYDASPIAADGKLFLASQEGRITVLSAGPEPKVLSSCDLGEPIHATPAIGADALFVRTDAALYCFGAKN